MNLKFDEVQYVRIAREQVYATRQVYPTFSVLLIFKWVY